MGTHGLVINTSEAAVQVCCGAQLDRHVEGELVMQEVWLLLGPAALLALPLLQAPCGREETLMLDNLTKNDVVMGLSVLFICC